MQSNNKVRHIDYGIHIGPGNHVEQLVRDSDQEKVIGILNVADDYPEMAHHRDVLYIHAGLNDGPEDWGAPWGAPNSFQAYLNAVRALDFLVKQCQVIYIHCHSGVSRSCFVLALYLSRQKQIPFLEAVEFIKERYSRIHIHPQHMDRLQFFLAGGTVDAYL